MVEIKVDNREILFRVVVSGPRRATKFAAVRELHDEVKKSGARDLTVIHAGGDRIVGFRWPLEPNEELFGMRIMVDVLARPGEISSPANDVLLYRSADAIIYLDDVESDEEDAQSEYTAFLNQLDSLSRKPEELPLLVQLHEEGDRSRHDIYVTQKEIWAPEFHVRGTDSESSLEILEAATDRVIDNYRSYESELKTRGLDGHIKIRDRVYECVPVDPQVLPSENSGEVRLVEDHDDHMVVISGTAFRLLIALIIVSSLVAAVVVVRAL